MYGNKKSVGFTPYDKSQGFSPTPANETNEFRCKATLGA